MIFMRSTAVDCFRKRVSAKDIKDGAWNRFVSSVSARLTVAQVVESIRMDALLTFDYISLLCIAR